MVSAVTAAQQAATGTQAAGTAGASSASAASLNYNSFLKLFMAELQNQDRRARWTRLSRCPSSHPSRRSNSR